MARKFKTTRIRVPLRRKEVTARVLKEAFRRNRTFSEVGLTKIDKDIIRFGGDTFDLTLASVGKVIDDLGVYVIGEPKFKVYAVSVKELKQKLGI